MTKSSYTFLDLAIEVLKQSGTPLTPLEIWNFAKTNNISQKINSAGKTPEASIGSQLYVEIKNNANSLIYKATTRPTRFALKNKQYVNNKQVNNVVTESNDSKNNFKERDLHILLSSFVNMNLDFQCLTKTIDHQKSPKEKKGTNEWLHPDIVGVHFPDEDYSDEIIKLQTQLGYRKYKIYSFEMKRCLDFSNLRESYFQAVSNSSWANEGYLVALNISEDPDFIQELRRLNNAFGIGIIKLNALHISQSEVLYPSKISETLDWDTINRLSENPVFKEFLQEITSTKRSNTLKQVYDKVYSDEECVEYCNKKNII
ncbi:MAG: HTH domain-containing protein [Succinivibrionaceae bacterium]